MAPVVDSRKDEDEARRDPRRLYLRQRITRDKISRKSVKSLSVESRDESVRRENKVDSGGDDHQGKEHKLSRRKGHIDDDDDHADNDDHNHTAVPTTSSVALPLTSSLTATLETMPASTLSRSPLSTTDVLIAAKPQISVSVWPATSTSFIPLMTTQSFETISTASASAQPRQASADPYTSTSGALVSSTCTESGVQTTLFAFENTPTSIVCVDDVNNDYDDMGHGDDHHGGHASSQGALSPSAENALISVGSIGGFIIVCFVFWIAWRMIKKSRRKADGTYGLRSSPPNPLLHFGRNQGGWQGLDDTPNEMLGSPPRYEKTTSIGQSSEIYSTKGPRSQAQFKAKEGPTVLPLLQTNLSSSNTFSPYSTPTSVDMQNPQMVSPSSQTSQQPTALPQLQTNLSPANNANLTTNTISPGNAASTCVTISPISTVQYGAKMGTMATDRPLMAHPFYNQSEPARQPSNAYDPPRRHLYRASDLSSLSSGFGDGDIIIPLPAALQTSPPGVSRFSYQKVPSVSRKDSIANASEAGSSNRDTIYTATSEDMPMRYRTVNSWVNQQTGRVQRAAQEADDDVPPVPMMPPEEKYTMMMDDEEPRRPDTVPVPALPEGTVNSPRPYAENKEMNP